MKRSLSRPLSIFFCVLLVGSFSRTGDAQGFSGTWLFDKPQSKNADFFDGESLLLKITSDGGSKMTINQIAKTEYDTRSTVTNVDLNGPETKSEWPKGDLPVFEYEAVAIGNDQVVMTKAVQGSDHSTFNLKSRLRVTVSQGSALVVLNSRYQLSDDGKTLTITVTRDSRRNADPVVYVFHKAG